MHPNDKSHVAPVENVAAHAGTQPGLVSWTGFCCTWLLGLTFSDLSEVIYRLEMGKSSKRSPFQWRRGSNRWLVTAAILNTQVLLVIQAETQRWDEQHMKPSACFSVLFTWLKNKNSYFKKKKCFHDKNISFFFCFSFYSSLLSRKNLVYSYKMCIKLTSPWRNLCFFRVPALSKFAVSTTSWMPEAIPE